MTSEAERQAFLEALTTSCTAPSPLRVVMTARTDMWDRVAAETTKFAMSVAPTVLHVPPLSRTDLAEVISEPARRSHLTLEDGLVQRLVDDTGSGDALPLLAFTLARMAADAEDGRLTHAEYDAIGGVKGAIASRAGEVAHGGRTEAEVAEAILHLVSLTDATPHKRLARAADVPPQHRAILDDLVDARLVVINEVNEQQVYAPGARVAVLGLAAAGRADREPPRRPGAARPARAPGRRLARGRRHPVRAAVRPRARPGPRLAAAQRATWRPPTSRRTSTPRSPGSAPPAGPDVGHRRGRRAGRRARHRLLVNSRSNRRLADPRSGWPTTPGSASSPRSRSRELVSDPVAAAIAVLRGPGAGRESKRLRTRPRSCSTPPAATCCRPSGATRGRRRVGRAHCGTGDATIWDLTRGTELGTLRGRATALRPDGRSPWCRRHRGCRSTTSGRGRRRSWRRSASPRATWCSPRRRLLMARTRTRSCSGTSGTRLPASPPPGSAPRSLAAVAVLATAQSSRRRTTRS